MICYLQCLFGAVDITPGSAQVGRGLVHLHLRSGPDLNQKFDVIVVPNASFVPYGLRRDDATVRLSASESGMRSSEFSHFSMLCFDMI